MGHTPGPWTAYTNERPIGIYTQAEDGSCGPQVASVLTENLTGADDSQAVADAQLIAAAPELLAMLKLLRGNLRTCPGPDVVAQVDEAIEKAEGQAP